MLSSDKSFNRFFGFAIGVWVVGALVSLTLAGTVIWGVIKLVAHFTA